MKAAIYDRWGPPDVLEVREVPMPVPASGQVLVRVAAAAVNPKDALVRAGKFAAIAGSGFPKIPGNDFAGTVAAVGPNVQGCAEGTPVFGMSNRMAGATCAEYVLADAGELAPKPPSLDFVEAASIPLVALTALQALRDCGGVGEGSEVCIHGASGGVGTVAVQIAKALGARVTALCGADSAGLVRKLGADEVLDYRKTPPASIQQKFDCFFDVYGNQSFATMKSRLKPRGVYVTTVPKVRNFIDHGRTLLWPGRRARLVIVKARVSDLKLLSDWIKQRRLRPVVAAVLPLHDIRKAHEMIETRRTHGKIVIRVREGQ
jgi:NADPH:quinone reductase-like Zn-dependent oxidoreductase